MAAARFEDLISIETLDLMRLRTAELAAEHAELAERGFQKPLLDFVPDDLSQEQLDSMSEKIRARASSNFLSLREQGKANDKTSIGLGFTALIVNAAPLLLDSMKEKLGITNEPTFDSPLIIELDQLEGIDSPLFALQAPIGTFSDLDTSDSIRFRSAATMVGHTVAGTGPSSYVSHIYVAKIIGESGELWTNSYPNALASKAIIDAQAGSF